MGCPAKWNQPLKPAVPWWFNFDPYPNEESAKRCSSWGKCVFEDTPFLVVKGGKKKTYAYVLGF